VRGQEIDQESYSPYADALDLRNMAVLPVRRLPSHEDYMRNYTRPTNVVFNLILVPTCLVSHLFPLSFNPPKESSKVQYVASPNGRAMFPALSRSSRSHKELREASQRLSSSTSSLILNTDSNYSPGLSCLALSTFNHLQKESPKVQYLASPNDRGTLPPPLCLLAYE
jgi:hypothetical protein